MLSRASIWYMYTQYRDIYALHLLASSHSTYSTKNPQQSTPVRQNRYATPTPKPIPPMLSPQPFLQAYTSLPKPQPRTWIPHPSLRLLLFLPIPSRGRRPPKPNPHLWVPHTRHRSLLERRLLLLLVLLRLWWRCRVAGSDGGGHGFFVLCPRVRGVGM